MSFRHVLTFQFEEKNDIRCFLTESKSALADWLDCAGWPYQLVFTSDIFCTLNKINLLLQSYNKILFNVYIQHMIFQKLYLCNCITTGKLRSST